jgi:hypothetical protein
LKVKEGDVLVCKCKDCTIELTVTKACNPDACGVECDISASCCDGTMRRIPGTPYLILLALSGILGSMWGQVRLSAIGPSYSSYNPTAAAWPAKRQG